MARISNAQLAFEGLASEVEGAALEDAVCTLAVWSSTSCLGGRKEESRRIASVVLRKGGDTVHAHR